MGNRKDILTNLIGNTKTKEWDAKIANERERWFVYRNCSMEPYSRISFLLICR